MDSKRKVNVLGHKKNAKDTTESALRSKEKLVEQMQLAEAVSQLDMMEHSENPFINNPMRIEVIKSSNAQVDKISFNKHIIVESMENSRSLKAKSSTRQISFSKEANSLQNSKELLSNDEQHLI